MTVGFLSIVESHSLTSPGVTSLDSLTTRILQGVPRSTDFVIRVFLFLDWLATMDVYGKRKNRFLLLLLLFYFAEKSET